MKYTLLRFVFPWGFTKNESYGQGYTSVFILDRALKYDRYSKRPKGTTFGRCNVFLF